MPRGPEYQLQSQVGQLARLYGWRHVHWRPAQTAHGWRTPGSGDSGFPDTILCRPPRLIVAECKSETGKLSPDQEAWLALLERCSVEVYVWRPRDWAQIQEVLQR